MDRTCLGFTNQDHSVRQCVESWLMPRRTEAHVDDIVASSMDRWLHLCHPLQKWRRTITKRDGTRVTAVWVFCFHRKDAGQFSLERCQHIRGWWSVKLTSSSQVWFILWPPMLSPCACLCQSSHGAGISSIPELWISQWNVNAITVFVRTRSDLILCFEHWQVRVMGRHGWYLDGWYHKITRSSFSAKNVSVRQFRLAWLS